MIRGDSTETFFRPPETSRNRWRLSGPIFNSCRLLLRRSPGGAVFVPIRNMQYLAVIDDEEIIFVDSQGGYRYQDGAGGRPILVSWQPRKTGVRSAIDEAVSCDVVYYLSDLHAVQLRLVGEFAQALSQLEQKHRDRDITILGAKIIKVAVAAWS